MGNTSRDRFGQRHAVGQGSRVPREQVSRQAYPHKWLQLESKRYRRTITFRHASGTLQGCGRRPIEVVRRVLLGLVGRTGHGQEANGVLPLLRSNRCTPDIALRRRGSDIPGTSPYWHHRHNGSDRSKSHSATKTQGPGGSIKVESVLSTTHGCTTFRTRAPVYDPRLRLRERRLSPGAQYGHRKVTQPQDATAL